jgi:signal peptidase II
MMAAMQKIGRIVALAIVLFACVSCDQATKAVAQEHLSATQPIWLFNGLVRLQVVENPGAFLSLGAGLPPAVQYWLFTGMVAAILAGFLIFILKEAQKMHMIVLVGVALLVGGGIGNLIDRVVNGGRVIDFIVVGTGILHTGIFNVADMAITVGVIVLLLYGLSEARGARTVSQ